MQLFVRVAETGSFSKAARTVGIGQPTASKLVAALEERLGAQLLRRTSRGLSLTEAGQDYYESAVRLLDEVDAAESRVGRGKVSPSGLVRMALSAGFGRLYVVPRLPALFARYPELSVDLVVSDRHVNLVEEGIDLAIRIGPLSDSTLVARRIGACEQITVASASYLARAPGGVPRTVADLATHACVVFTSRGAPRAWQLVTPDGSVAFQPRGPVRSHDAEHLRAAVLAGLGIAHQLSWLFADDLAAGTVERVMADHDTGRAPFPVSAVTPGGRMIPTKTKVVIDYLAEICASEPTLRLR